MPGDGTVSGVNSASPVRPTGESTAVISTSETSPDAEASGNTGISTSLLSLVQRAVSSEKFEKLHRVLTFNEYVGALEQNPALLLLKE
mgnify:CR=1 FL=1